MHSWICGAFGLWYGVSKCGESSAGCGVQWNVSGVECQDRSVRSVTLGVHGGEKSGRCGAPGVGEQGWGVTYGVLGMGCRVWSTW